MEVIGYVEVGPVGDVGVVRRVVLLVIVGDMAREFGDLWSV